MAALMKDWITPTAVHELSGAFETLRSQYTAGETLQKYPYDCSPAAVTVHLKTGRRVQLIEFHGGSDPFDVTLSDGTTKIRATFTVECAAGCGSSRDAVKDALGAVLGIAEYYLIYKPSSPRSERLTLRITKFKILGSQGERVFGKPEGIEEQESIWDVLTRFEKTLPGSESNNTNGLDEELDIRSQAGEMDDQQSSPIASMATQTPFATQVSVKAQGFQPAVNFPKSHAVGQGMGLLALLRLPKAAAAEKTAGLTESSHPICSDIFKEPADLGLASSNCNRPRSLNDSSILKPVSETRKAEMSSKLESRANSQSSLPAGDSKEVGFPQQESNPPPSSNVVPGQDSEKENSQESSKELFSRHPPIHQEAENEAVIVADLKDVSDVLIARNREDNPFEGMKRVPRSFVRIPRNQQALLESPDSWYTPEKGTRANLANIPSDVAHDLISFIDQRRLVRRDDDGVSEDAASEPSPEPETEPNISQIEEAKETGEDDSSNDDESAVSWPESHYPDPNDSEGVPEPSLEELDNEPLEMADINATSAALDLPSAQNSNARSPLASNPPTATRFKANIEYNFPSSSPGDEEELEIAVPYAVDDTVDENAAESAQEMVTSQELPSTAVANQTVIQVKHTPDHNVTREARDSGNGDEPDLEHRRRVFTEARAIGGHVSSDPVIPATFHECSQESLLYSTSKHPPSSGRPSRPEAPKVEEEHLSPEEHECVVGLQGVVQEPDEMIEEQLFAELKSSQFRRSEAIDSSPFLPVDHRTSNHSVEAIPTKNEMLGNVSPLLRSPQEPNSSSFHTALPEIRSEPERPPSSPVKEGFLRPSDEPQQEVRTLKNSRPIKYPAVNHSQPDIVFKDTVAMTRAARHSFTENSPSPIEELAEVLREPSQLKSPSDFKDLVDWTRSARASFYERVPSLVEEVQVAQSQPNAPPKDPYCLSRQAADPRVPQSSNDFVSSTIPERTEATITDRSPGDLPTSPSKESSQLATLHQPQHSPGIKVIEPSESGKISTVESSDGTDDHPKSVFIQSTQNAERNAEKVKANEKSDIISLSSDSDEEDLAEEDSEEGMQGGEVVAEESDMSDEKEMMSEPEQIEEDLVQLTETQEIRSSSTQPTAFDKFKSIYPSYSGKEKNFVWALVYIEWLVANKGEDFLRASLWDDFIRTLSDEYMEYIKEVRGSDERIRTGFEYFNKLDKFPIFQQRIITPDNLRESLLTLHPVQVEKVRHLFNKSKPPLVEYSQSSHGPQSEASKNSQNMQVQEESVADVVIDTARAFKVGRVQESSILEAPQRSSIKRPFFETPSQVQAAKRPRTFASPKEQFPIEVPRSSKSRRSLPWTQSTATPSSPNPNTTERPTISAPATSSRIKMSSVIAKSRHRSPASTSLNGGSPPSPILGDPEPSTRSFDVSKSKPRSTSSASGNRGSLAPSILGQTGLKSRSFDVRDTQAASLDSSPLFKKPSASVSKAALMEESATGPSRAGIVEGWLDDTEHDTSHRSAAPVSATKIMHRKESIKRKRQSALDLLDMQTPIPKANSVRVSRPVASSVTSRASDIPSGVVEVKREMSFKDFLKKRRESGQSFKMSTPDSKVASVSGSGKRVERTPVQHAEPETQAWGI